MEVFRLIFIPGIVVKKCFIHTIKSLQSENKERYYVYAFITSMKELQKVSLSAFISGITSSVNTFDLSSSDKWKSCIVLLLKYEKQT